MINCPNCNSTNMTVKPGYTAHTANGQKRRRTCKVCGGQYDTLEPAGQPEHVVRTVQPAHVAISKKRLALRRKITQDLVFDVQTLGRFSDENRAKFIAEFIHQ